EYLGFGAPRPAGSSKQIANASLSPKTGPREAQDEEGSSKESKRTKTEQGESEEKKDEDHTKTEGGEEKREELTDSDHLYVAEDRILNTNPRKVKATGNILDKPRAASSVKDLAGAFEVNTNDYRPSRERTGTQT
ncbi:hypothetical protein M9458_016162, partial [Cirrhinus mrigala]